MDELPPPAGFHSAAGNWVTMTDTWVEESAGPQSEAEIIDTVTGERHRFILAEDEDEDEDILTMRWFRRISAEHYIRTETYHVEAELPDDPDEATEIFCEAIRYAETELVMAVAVCPRYDIEAEWLTEQDRELINTGHANAHDLDQEEINFRRRQIFGTTNLF